MLDSIQTRGTAFSKPMAKKTVNTAKSRKTDEEIPGQSERLIRMRTAFDFKTSTAFAAFIGISVQRYNAFENGAGLSKEVAFRICQKLAGVSLDWLYFGKSDTLSFEVRRRLGELDPPVKGNT